MEIDKLKEVTENKVFDDEILNSMLDCKLDKNYVPIIYRKENNISALGLEKLHRFDPSKYMHISNFLREKKVLNEEQKFIKQKKVTNEQLFLIHTKEYIDSLKWSYNLAIVLEFPLIAVIPNFILQSFLVNPMLYQVGGTILGGEIALRYGWCICLSGGMHHASSDRGGGWCVYSDIPISIKSLKGSKKIKTSMIIDLDVHQGNGHERDKLSGLLGNEEETYIFDMYNCRAYPRDKEAKQGINKKIEIKSQCDGDEYIMKLKNGLKDTFEEYTPDIIFYNAGTDILDGDPLGRCCVPENDVIKRDELVFEYAINNNIPIVMVLSGGYMESNARVISESIENLDKKFDLIKLSQNRFEKK
eukprot:gene6001-9999_t